MALSFYAYDESVRHGVFQLAMRMGLGLVAFFAAPYLTRGDDARSPVVGRHIEDFALRDFRGKEYRLAESTKSVVVVTFLGTECPLARLYVPRLVELREEFADRSVVFLGIVSNRQDSIAEISHFARANHVRFPMLKDPGNRVADLFHARRTPEAFVLDRDRVIRYRGRIDNQYGFQKDGRSFQRNKPTRRDLALAIEAVLSGNEVSVPETVSPGCKIGRLREPDSNSPVTWSKQISRIFQRHCQSCHRPGEIAPFPLLSYDEVQGWEAMIQEVVQQNRMPPWTADSRAGQFANDSRLSDDEKRLIDTWVAHGSPEGDPDELPPPKPFVAGWRIGQPDAVLYMDDRPFDVPAEGVVEYQYFVVDPDFAGDRWIKAAEYRPGNPAVVHHINVFLLPAEKGDQFERDELTNDLLWGFAPGVPPTVLPSGMAIHLPRGTRLVFQLHYTPNGTPQQDRSYMGLVFADPSEVRKQVRTVLAVNTKFEIPPGAANHLVESWYDFDRDALLISMIPHMHLRGKSFRYVAHYPDGSREELLDVPRYDFNWQNTYVLSKPKLIPARTRIQCEATFDNSEDNLANPDPESPVRWGDQTWDEMMIGYLQIAVAKEKVVEVAASGDRPVWANLLWFAVAAGAATLGLLVLLASRQRMRAAEAGA